MFLVGQKKDNLGDVGNGGFLDKFITGTKQISQAAVDIRNITREPEPVVMAAQPTIDYTPWLLGGAGLLAVVFFMKRK